MLLRNAGLDCITIGLESDRAEEHDAVRGAEGSYQTAMDAIGVARAAGLFTAISTMATREKLCNGKHGAAVFFRRKTDEGPDSRR